MQNIIFFIRENLLLGVIWLSLFIAIILLTINNFFSKYTMINNHQTIKLINQENAIIIDTRIEKLFQRSHIVNSINIPIENILSEKINELKPYRNLPIILIINTSSAFHQYIEKLYKYGFYHIYVLENGIDSWNIEHLPLISMDK